MSNLILVLFSLSACFCMGFAYILKVFSFFGVRATILNLKSHYTRHVKLDFGVSVALCLFLYGFAYVSTLGHTAEDSIRSDLEAILSATGLFTTCQT